ncbi:hypothetical protein H0H81_010741 [Sphagnurus paluster]|uniref:Phosphomevalonate kinase n=1 Tax=Sphagnurus paluster TaxID=117069 RepID=A0A9P7K2H1_9AGAR|nr:hypothetical protein H0H81_010741 [Sphagnurus paluster]
MAQTTVVSAPGKVLISGGYLVLDPKYSGTVVSTSSRFYTVVRDDISTSSNSIRVRSPQFLDATWGYSVSTAEGTVAVEALSTKYVCAHLEPISSEMTSTCTSKSNNKFVHLALQSTLTLAAEISGIASVGERLSRGLDISIVGDNDFYSQRETLAALNLPRTLASLHQIPPFMPTKGPLSSVHKTGLGSSAALITSLVSALLLHFSSIPASALDTPKSPGRALAHNLAQYVHCRAQGKVGSGFDVAAAVFGSHRYTRFNPDVIDGLMGAENLRSQVLRPILSPENEDWDHVIRPFKLPPLTRLMLADVDAGSDTPSLVGKVLKWRNSNPEDSLALWTSLDKLNTQLAATLVDLSDLHDKDPGSYITAVKYIASMQAIQAIRAKMRDMGERSGVPIEPPEQTQLLDACVALAGVVGGGVPGAGGYDAIWLLVCEPLDVAPDIPPRERVENVWANYTALDVSPLSVVESLAGGVRVEAIDSIRGLEEATRPV